MSDFLNAKNASKWLGAGGGFIAGRSKTYLWSKNIERNSTNRSDIETAVLQLLEYDHLLETFLDQFNRWKPERGRTIREITQIADETDGLRWGCNVANITGSTLSTLGGALTVAGILAAPVTLGGSLSLSVAGTGITLGGAATNITTSVVECRKMKGSFFGNIFFFCIQSKFTGILVNLDAIFGNQDLGSTTLNSEGCNLMIIS